MMPLGGKQPSLHLSLGGRLQFSAREKDTSLHPYQDPRTLCFMEERSNTASARARSMQSLLCSSRTIAPSFCLLYTQGGLIAFGYAASPHIETNVYSFDEFSWLHPCLHALIDWRRPLLVPLQRHPAPTAAGAQTQPPASGILV
jgi:hypothetical protein